MVKLLTSLALPIVCLPLQACPQSFTELSTNLSKDLHHYLNRSYSKYGIKTQAQVVSFPDRAPLPIKETDPAVKQLFLTIAHRRSEQLTTENQTYWLFLVETAKGWKLSMAFTRVGDAPPIDVSDGAVADAMRSWLKDKCPSPL
ncbi:MAG: hypothetical protein CV045_07845 [Cyanobacteria bacterium M5B4]|nr:MAG: hypothetical protein CV045_07845 [Cyanobacteria bacterium M5B4]